ncbi:hypothetical protein AURANDRAFT_62797 [Aureococcus anophagefferens]|uniref:Uncharacterized protein n=1 Tax=Aureococcus anophagefferens TaxID=44056 RepID=F0Y338_AURAN|nr:hypothetical protein AURANDRAFT_62797 [Aureococcus anophagefferens]EGB10315.1 hypothetical protein AURANDRAFT_62797 [Aureococcus anophagefferens]|eukprot:XP_009035122.1 hypothetical protein AURANDRAFT_62797 [Aureococcus anophagefferens]
MGLLPLLATTAAADARRPLRVLAYGSSPLTGLGCDRPDVDACDLGDWTYTVHDGIEQTLGSAAVVDMVSHLHWTARRMCDHFLDRRNAAALFDAGTFVSAESPQLRVGLGSTLAAMRDAGDPVDVVVIFAGHEDLRGGATPEDVGADVVQLHAHAQALGVSTVAAAIPYVGADPYFFDFRKRVHDVVRRYCEGPLVTPGSVALFSEWHVGPQETLFFTDPEGAFLGAPPAFYVSSGAELGLRVLDAAKLRNSTRYRSRGAPPLKIGHVNYDEAKDWSGRHHEDIEMQEIRVQGWEPRQMALRVIDEANGLGAEDCGWDQACLVDQIVNAITTDLDMDVHNELHDYQLFLAKDDAGAPVADAPLVVCCSSFGGVLNYEFKGMMKRTFGETVHALYVRDVTKRFYLGGVRGLGGDPGTTARAIATLLGQQGLAPSAVLCVGDSMGGTGALLLGAHLRASAVVVTNPFVVLAEDDFEFPANLDLRELWRSVGDAGCGTRATVFHALKCSQQSKLHNISGKSPPGVCRDDHQAQLLARASPCVDLAPVDVDVGHHGFARMLRDQGDLSAAFARAIDGAAPWASPWGS